MLNWRTMGAEEFNRVAEALVRRTVEADNPGLEVKAIDGRGGDGGIDLDSHVKSTGQLVAIYQLKFFPEGFSGEWARARKPQIRKSFDTACEHNPQAWYLVVPRNLAPKERSFVRSLERKNSNPKVKYIGAAELDGYIARFPEIEEWAERNPLRTALSLTGRGTAALSMPHDLGAEVGELHRRTTARSDYWGVDFSLQGGVYTESFVALRPDSAIREPLCMTLTADFANDPELGVAFERSMHFGSDVPIVLPAHVIQSFTQSGPDWFSGEAELSSFEISQTPIEVDGPASLALFTVGGQALARRKAARVSVVRGTVGAQVTVEFSEGLIFGFKFKRAGNDDGIVNVSSNLQGLTGTEARSNLRFLESLADAKTAELVFGGGVAKLALKPTRVERDVRVLELAEDLAVIEDELNIALSFPDTLPPGLERIWLRVVRHMLEGKVSLMPAVTGMNLTLEGHSEPALEELLRNGGAIRKAMRTWEVHVLGETILVDDVSILMPSAIAVDGHSHADLLARGKGAGRHVEFLPTDGKAGVLIWSPSRIGDLEVLSPTPWGITHIDEHTQMRTSGP